jgi:tripartite-type tricarboxylate transporter receptor subunit TctC
VARIIAPKLGEEFRQQVIVDNRGGADGIIGTDLAAKAPPDGHTLFLGTAGNLAINQSLYSKVPFDIARDFAPLSQVVSVDMMLTVNSSLPVKTVKELVAMAKAKPGQLNYGSTGVGGIPHLTSELLNRIAEVDIHHVPYKGGGPAMTDLIAGHIQVYVQSVVQGAASVKDGRVRAIAILGPKRSSVLPDVPTMSETLPGYEATNWYGMVVQSATPASVQKRIYSDLSKVLHMTEVRDSILAQGAVPLATPPEEFAAFLKSETAKWAKVIKDANIRAE